MTWRCERGSPSSPHASRERVTLRAWRPRNFNCQAPAGVQCAAGGCAVCSRRVCSVQPAGVQSVCSAAWQPDKQHKRTILYFTSSSSREVPRHFSAQALVGLARYLATAWRRPSGGHRPLPST
eukprot:1560414-Rhodomonas_salina.1